MSLAIFFHNLVIIENIFGIYRNYCKQNKIKKCFIILVIFAQIVWHTVIVFQELHLLLGEVNYDQINLILAGFSASAYLSSLVFVLTGVCYSHSFMSYYRGISRVSECFKDDNKLMISLKKTYRFSICFIIYAVAFSIFRSADTYLRFSQFKPSILVPILITQTITRIAIVFQDLMLFLVTIIVVHLFESLISLISVAQEGLKNCDISSDELCHITKEQIQGWVELYQDLNNCCHRIMLCFGRQFFFSIILSILHYILMAYSIFYKNVLNIGNTEEYSRVGIVLFGYFSVMMMPLVAGQKAKNQGVKFQRVLVRLYNTINIDSDEAEGKLIKDFIRLIKRNPIEIKLTSKVPAGMYMLPVILSMAVNYLIVMLQFNHII